MFKKSLIALSLALAATGSFAQVYVQGAIGQGAVNVEGAAGTTVKKTSTSNKFAVGYEFGNGWAIEGAMVNFGKNTVTVTSTGSTAELKANSLAIGGVYTADLGGGHGLKGALYYGSNKAEFGGAAAAATAVGSQTSGALNYAFGYSYGFTTTTSLTVDYDVAKFKYDKAVTGDFGTRLLSVGVRFKF